MSGKIRILFSFALFFTNFINVHPWAGNYCTRITQSYASRVTCAGSWFCWGQKTVIYAVYSTEYYCCSGWTDGGTQNCYIPVCSPPCSNGGTCYAPNKCQCRTENVGPLCDDSVCSHLSPCYPGTCLPNSQCRCQTGFETIGGQSVYCLNIQNILYDALRIYQIRARLSAWQRFTTPAVEKYFLVAESSDHETNETVMVWTRSRDFNRVDINCTSQFFLPDLPPLPSYISRSGFGIVRGLVELWQSKLNAQGGRTESQVGTLNCARIVNNTSPETGIYNCFITNVDMNYNLEHGDYLRITYRTGGGGFRELYNSNPPTPSVYSTQFYQGIERTLSVEFRFDTVSPTHCQESSSCLADETMLHVQDITKLPLTIFWNGWTDRDSGMYRYAVDIYKLTQTFNKTLEVKREDVSSPIYRQEISHPLVGQVHFTPSEPGMYAIVLTIADKALNAKYVRRLCLYDPTSSITTDINHALFVSTASKVSDYAYQSDVNGTILVTWDLHFRNELHDTNDLLGRVLSFPEVVGEFPKVIPPEMDDNEGQRTIKAKPNLKGIVNFEVAYALDHKGGQIQPAYPLSAWVNVYLNTTFILPVTPTESSTVTIWVKATDAMNNTKVERTKVTMDSTPPTVHSLEFHMNTAVTGINFSSTISLLVQDNESGIAYILWTVKRSNLSVIFQEKREVTLIQSCSDRLGSCYCTSTQECYLVDQSYSLSNCHMIVEKRNLATENILVLVEIVNKAGKSAERIITGIDVKNLNETNAYFPPQNIKTKVVSDTSVVLTWDLPPSCVERTEVWVIINDEKRPVHKDALQFDITGLSPATSYTIYMQISYAGGEISDSQPFTVTTTKELASTGMIVGGVIGSILVLLLILLVLMFVLWRKGFILQKPGRINKQLNRMSSAYNFLKNIRISSRKTGGEQYNRNANTDCEAFPNVVHTKDDNNACDELYMYGALMFDSGAKWQLDDSNLTMLNKVTEGKFAVIYKANLRASSGTGEIVAIKMLKPGFTKDDEQKMMAKINFAAHLETHENVIKFVGAITRNTSWGPVLVMEYCQLGQLDNWLASKKDNIDDQLIENLYQFSCGIANGMTYLAAKKVVHTKLAARNILLTSRLEVRVAGFGPQATATEENKATRIPAKWAAPEVLEDKPSTEKSDVWSFGIVLWEIFSMGSLPYSDIQSRELGTRLKGGYRLSKPELADGNWYQMMNDCWKFSPKERPPFARIREQIDHLFSSSQTNTGFYYESCELKR